MAESGDLYRRLMAARDSAETIPVRSSITSAPLSWGQERLWLLDALTRDITWNIPRKLRIVGDLDLVALTEAVHDLQARHASLRTRFPMRGGVVVQETTAPSIDLPIHDLRPLDDVARRARLDEVDALHKSAFEVEAGPLWRIDLARIGDSESVLWLTLHRLICDGWSLKIVVRDLDELYTARVAGRAPQMPALPIEYGDYATWQRELLATEQGALQLAAWRERLRGVQAIALPTVRTAPRVRSHRGGFVAFEIPAEVAERLRELCAAEDVTLFMALLTAFDLLLSRYAATNDIAVITPVANRIQREVRNVVGAFANTVVLRTNLMGTTTFRDALHRVREVVLDGFAHQDMPFDRLVESLRPSRGYTSTLFNVMFSLQTAQTHVHMTDLVVETIWEPPDQSEVDLAFLAFSEDLLEAKFVYDADLFDRATIQQMVDHLQRLLAHVVADPLRPLASLDVLDEAEQLDRDPDAPPTRRATYIIAAAEPPRDAQEEVISRIWSDVLGIDAAGVHEDFFTVSGHSLLALRLLAQVENELGVRVMLPVFLARPTVRGLADAVKENSQPHSHRPALTRTRRTRGKLTAPQRGTYLLDRVARTNRMNRLIRSTWLTGALDVPALELALNALRERNTILRTRFFVEGGEPWQETLETIETPILIRADISELAPLRQEDADIAAHEQLLQRPYDLERGETVRVLLVTYGPTKHRLTLALHRVVCDQQSIQIFDEDLQTLWHAFSIDPDRAANASPPPQIQYLDLVDYLERLARSEIGQAQRAYWEEKLAGAEPLVLAADLPRAAIDTRRVTESPFLTFPAAWSIAELGPRGTAAVDRVARNADVSAFSVLLSAMATYLTEQTGQRDLALVSHLLFRHIPGLERTLGLFSNPLVMRLSTEGAPTLHQLLRRTHDTVASTYDHGEFDVLAVAPHLFRMFFNYLYAAKSWPEPDPPPGVTRETSEVPGAHVNESAYDLNLTIAHQPERIVFRLYYLVDLFTPDGAARFLQGYIATIERLCA